MIDFLSLPVHSLLKIYTFVDDKTILQMREVSQSTMDLMRLSSLSSTKTGVNTLQFLGKSADMSVVFYFFGSFLNYFAWRSCFDNAFFLLNITNCMYERDGNAKWTMTAGMNSEELGRFLGHIKPLIRKTTIQFLNLSLTDSEIVSLCTNFLENTRIQQVSIEPPFSESNNLSVYLDMVRKLKPEHIYYSTCMRPFQKESIEFLWQLADMVKSLSIFAEFYAQCEIISIILLILNRKCEKLTIHDNGDDGHISHVDIEKLIKHLHHSDKKMSLTMYTDVEAMTKQFGAYKLSVEDRENRRGIRKMSIKHIDLI